MRRGIVPALLTALVVAVPGCQTGDESGPAEAAQAATETFLYTCAIGRVTGAELVLTEQMRAKFIAAGKDLAGCMDVMDFELPGETPTEKVKALFEDAGTTAVHTSESGFATVEVRARGMHRLVELEVIRGRWLIGHVRRA